MSHSMLNPMHLTHSEPFAVKSCIPTPLSAGTKSIKWSLQLMLSLWAMQCWRGMLAPASADSHGFLKKTSCHIYGDWWLLR